MFRLKKIWLVPLLVTAVALAIVITLSTRQAVATTTPTLSASQIDGDALAVSASLGDTSPTLIQHVTGSRAEANEVAGGEQVPDTTQSVLIAIRGNFTDTAASVPQGAQAPTGTVLTLVVDEETNSITDLGLSDNYPDLASVGSVTTDSTSSAQSASMRRALREHRAP